MKTVVVYPNFNSEGSVLRVASCLKVIYVLTQSLARYITYDDQSSFGSRSSVKPPADTYFDPAYFRAFEIHDCSSGTFEENHEVIMSF